MNERDSQGRPTGLWEERFSGGGLSGTGRYEEGEKDGEWTYWHKNDQLKARGCYVHGKLDGSLVCYRAGGGCCERYTGVGPTDDQVERASSFSRA